MAAIWGRRGREGGQPGVEPLDRHPLLSPPRDARSELTWSRSSKVTSCSTGTRRLRRRRALNSLPATLRSVPRTGELADATPRAVTASTILTRHRDAAT